MSRIHPFQILTSILLLALVAGCGNDLTDPDSGDVSQAARSAAVQRTDEVLRSTELTRTAMMVEDLTGGFAVGLSEEAVGLDMELGQDFAIPARSAAGLSIGASIDRARISRQQAAREFT
ncbi:hypothetical protein DRQ53_13480, partial [bacterium]